MTYDLLTHPPTKKGKKDKKDKKQKVAPKEAPKLEELDLEGLQVSGKWTVCGVRILVTVLMILEVLFG